MTESNRSASRDAWALIDTERKRDRLIRRICIAAWTATLVVALLFAALVSTSVIEMVSAARAGAVPWSTVVGVAMPFMGALWTLCLLVASLSTVAVFLRLRTASLAEIQLRLAALEDRIAGMAER